MSSLVIRDHLLHIVKDVPFQNSAGSGFASLQSMAVVIVPDAVDGVQKMQSAFSACGNHVNHPLAHDGGNISTTQMYE